MKENEIVKLLEKHFKEMDNAVLEFTNYSKDTTEIVVKGTVEEWNKFLNELKN